MRVCLFTETFHPVIGGGETQARLLAEGLTSEHVPTFVLTRRSDPGLPSTEQVGSLPVSRLRPTGSGQLKKWGLVLSGVPPLMRRHREYDVLLLCGFRIIGLSAVLAAKTMGKKVVLKADSQGEMSGAFFTAGLARVGVKPSSFAFRTFLALRNAILRRADAFVAITAEVADELREAGIPADRIHRIPNAVDTARFHPAEADQKRALRDRLALPRDGAIVTYTGRLVTYKGLPLLVDVWSRLTQRFPQATLLLVGTGGLDIHACEDALREEVRARGMEGSVRFTGGVQNVEDYLRASDVFVFPTENDAFPSSVIEAMTTRLPVIATPVGAIPEMVTDGIDGLLVPPGDGAALEAALVRVLSDPTLAGRLGMAAWSTVQERYSAEGVTTRYLDLLRAISGGDPGGSPPA